MEICLRHHALSQALSSEGCRELETQLSTENTMTAFYPYKLSITLSKFSSMPIFSRKVYGQCGGPSVIMRYLQALVSAGIQIIKSDPKEVQLPSRKRVNWSPYQYRIQSNIFQSMARDNVPKLLAGFTASRERISWSQQKCRHPFRRGSMQTQWNRRSFFNPLFGLSSLAGQLKRIQNGARFPEDYWSGDFKHVHLFGACPRGSMKSPLSRLFALNLVIVRVNETRCVDG